MSAVNAIWWFRTQLDRYRGLLLGRPGPTSTLNGDDLRDAYRMHLFRRQLLELLALYGAEAGSRQHDPVAVADCVSLIWGAKGHPCSPSEAKRLMDLRISISTIEKWPEQVLGNQVVRHRMEMLAERHKPESGARGPRPRPEDAAVLLRVQAALEDGTGDVRSWTGDGSVIDTNLAVSVLRDATAELVDRWYFSGEAPGLAHLRHFRLTVAPSWFSDDAVEGTSTLYVVGGRGAKTRYRRAVDAAVPMLMYAAAEDGPTLRRAAARRTQLGRRFMLELPALRRPEAADRVAADPTRYEAASRLVVAGAATTALLAANPIADPARIAAAVRETVYSERDLAIRWINRYVQDRHMFQGRATTDATRLNVALADQSIHWDCVVLDQHRLARRLAAVARTESTAPGIAYLALTWRCIAVLENKAGRWAHSLWEISAGLQALRELCAEQLVPDARQRDAALQQLMLAGAGVSLRMLETRLAGSARSSDHSALAQLARTALECSRLAMAILNQLESTGLPKSRGRDGLIANRTWLVQSRIIRIRVLLAVLTAIEAGLLRRGDLLSLPSTAHPLPALGAFEATADDLTDCDRRVVASLYRQLLRLPELSGRHAVAMVRLAAWLAFLDGGRVPVEEDAAPVVLQAPTLLDADPAACAEGLADRHLDVGELTTWLALRSADAGVLSWLPRHQAAAVALDRRSGLFQTFREWHDVYRPAQPSPD